MTKTMTESERKDLPKGVVLFYDRLKAAGLYDPCRRGELPKAVLTKEAELVELHERISDSIKSCTDCAIVCAGTKNLCTVARDRKQLKEDVSHVEAEITNLLIFHNAHKV